MGEVLYAQAVYTLSQKQLLEANKKLHKKLLRQNLFLAIGAIFLAVVIAAAHFVFKAFIEDSDSDNSALIFAALVLYIGLLFLCIYLGTVKTAEKRSKLFFLEYNVGDQLIYDVQCSETEIVLKVKDNVTHMTKKCIEKVVDVGDYVGIVFSLGTVHLIPKTSECEQLIQAFFSLAPDSKKK